LVLSNNLGCGVPSVVAWGATEPEAGHQGALELRGIAICASRIPLSIRIIIYYRRRTRMDTLMRAHAHTRTHTRANARTHTHTHTHTHIHEHKQMVSCSRALSYQSYARQCSAKLGCTSAREMCGGGCIVRTSAHLSAMGKAQDRWGLLPDEE